MIKRAGMTAIYRKSARKSVILPIVFAGKYIANLHLHVKITENSVAMSSNHITNGYNAAKTSAAWSIARQFGVLRLSGSDSLDLLNRLSTNRLDTLIGGQGRQTVLTNEKGRIIDVLTVFAVQNEILALTSPYKQREVAAWIKKYIVMDDVRVYDKTENYRFVEILGPAASMIVQQMIGGDSVLNMPMSGYITIKVGSVETMLFRAPSVAETSYIFMLPANTDLSEILARGDSVRTPFRCQTRNLSEILARGDLPEATAADFHVLRVESGLPIADCELTADFNPLEAGLVHIIDFKKGCYIGQEVIARLDSYNKVQKRIMGFVSTSEIKPSSDIHFDGKNVGRITSSTDSPEFGHIALGYIRGDAASAGAVAQIEGGVEVCISNLPFTAK